MDAGQKQHAILAANNVKNPNRNPMIEFVERYAYEPVLFVKEVLGKEPDEWQAKTMTWVAQGERQISVRSGHGVGKSSCASWLMLWYFMLRYPVKVVVTAPTSSQLYDALFAELKSTVLQLPSTLQKLMIVKTDRIVHISRPDDAFISARTSRQEQPEALQGVHSSNVLLVADEASGIPEAVFEAASGSMSGEHATTLLLGNPTKGSGFFYDTHHRLSGQWKTLRVSCEDSPRVSEAYIEQAKLRYGADSNAYRVRVLGEFPTADDDTIISLEVAQAAVERDVKASSTAPVVWGIDVARFGDDKSALAKRKANELLEPIRVWSKLDTMQLTGAIKAEYDRTEGLEKPVELLVDSIGVGAGVVDRLIELGLPARGVNVSEVPGLSKSYANLRAELWYKARDWLTGRESRLPKDQDLIAELVTPRYKFTSAGKILVESKDDMKRRGLPSPDRADAFVLTFASDAAIMLHGRRSSDWTNSLRRNVPIV